jgi:hypothetical protein
MPVQNEIGWCRAGQIFKNASAFFSTPDFKERRFNFVKRFGRFLAITLLFFAAALGGCIYFFAPLPPKESKLIQNFNQHRATFMQLRDMLQSDTNLARIANWGVETRAPFFLGFPPENVFPGDRFKKYLALI